jgi:hypothetical protein
MVRVMLHGIHCGFSMIPVVSIDRLLVLVLHRFQMVLLVLAQSSYGDSSSNSLCPAIPFGLSQMEQISIVSDWQSLFWQVRAQPMLIDHLFHLFLDCRKFSVRECDGDGDWVIALYQFEWGMNSFSVSSIIVCELQSAE